MLYAECNCRGGNSVVVPGSRIGVVDSDDGVLEWVDRRDLLNIMESGIPLYNIYLHNVAVVSSPLLTHCHYTVGDTLFIFKNSEVLVFFGNDYMMHLELISENCGIVLYINNERISPEGIIGGCFGVPGRLSINSKYFVRVFEHLHVYDTITIEKSKAQHIKGCRQHYLRKLLL